MPKNNKKIKEKKCMLAGVWTKGMPAPRSDPSCLPPEDWEASEKFDGYRGLWDGDEGEFYSRAGKMYNSPELFKKAMPKEDLDGELWCGRDQEDFQYMGCVRKKVAIDEDWAGHIKYIVYDLPGHGGTFKERLEELKKIVEESRIKWNKIRKVMPEPYRSIECPLVMAEQTTIKSEEHLQEIFKEMVNQGCEGVIIKDPSSMYEDGRSNYMLKVKPVYDEEAIIVDYKSGKGKNEMRLGAFICKPLINMDTYQVIDEDETHEFAISGMDDEVRESYKETHPIGTIITIEHSGKTGSGKPRFARYIRKREDVVLKELKDVPKTTEKRDLVISIFKKISDSEKANGERFKASSYLKAISGLKGIEDDSDLTEKNITAIKGVGKSLCEKVIQIIKTGTCPAYEKIKNKKDSKQLFMDIHGVGPKKAAELVKVGFETIEDLKQSKEKGEYLNNVQLLGLKHYDDLLKRIPREEIEKHESILKIMLKKVDPSAELTIAGSYRRNCADSGDIDVLLKSENKGTYDKFIKKLKSIVYIIEDLAYGEKKYNGISKLGRSGIGRRIDIMYTKPEEYPFAVLYFTGSGDFNKMMREQINEKGMTINEYSLKDIETKEIVDHVFVEEKDIFDYLDMLYIEPWQRNL
tara:strand:+ start:419 stop:2323 length:1905 start_codon:yes stop_codon:yes gene_type:complete